MLALLLLARFPGGAWPSHPDHTLLLLRAVLLLDLLRLLALLLESWGGTVRL